MFSVDIERPPRARMRLVPGVFIVGLVLTGGVAMAQNPGLLGHYYGDMDLLAEPMTRVDPQVDFEWGGEGPYPEMDDNFFVRWVGLLNPLYAEEYVFTAEADDGVRVWIDGHLVIDHWRDKQGQFGAGSVSLNPSRSYPVIVEYYEGGGNAAVEWLWESRSQEREIIPSGVLVAANPFGAGTPVVQLHSKDAWATEGGRDRAFVTVFRFGRWSPEIVVNLSYRQEGDLHRTGTPETVTLGPGVSAAQFEIGILNDDTLSGDGLIEVGLEPGDGYTVGDVSTQTVRLLDDERPIRALGYGVGGEIVATGVALDANFVAGVFADEALSAPIDTQVVVGPGPFAIDDLPAGDYFVAAWRDANRDGAHDAGEPWAKVDGESEVASIALPPDAVHLVFTFETPADDEPPAPESTSLPPPGDAGCDIASSQPSPMAIIWCLCLALGVARVRSRP